MTIKKCDKCKKVIKNKPVFAGFGRYYANVELCENCGKPVIGFLVANNLLVEESAERKYTLKIKKPTLKEA